MNPIYFENNFPNLEITVYDNFFNLKKKQIIDTFIFYNEISLLEYRLSLLKDTVDHFVLVESTLTHVGKPKEMYFDILRKNYINVCQYKESLNLLKSIKNKNFFLN